MAKGTSWVDKPVVEWIWVRSGRGSFPTTPPGLDVWQHEVVSDKLEWIDVVRHDELMKTLSSLSWLGMPFRVDQLVRVVRYPEAPTPTRSATDLWRVSWAPKPTKELNKLIESL